MKNRSPITAFAVAALSVVGVTSHAGPINSNTAFAPHQGESILRIQYRYLEVEDDPSVMNRELKVQGLTAVYIYGFNEKFTGILTVPYRDKNLELASGGGGRVTRDSRGVGDIRSLLKYRVFTRDTPGKTHRLGVFGGLEWPTGKDNQKDSLGRLPQTLQAGSGSYDPIIGTVWTTQTLGWEFDADIGYKFNTEANNFEFGDVFSYNISYQHRLLPRELPEEGVPSFVYGVFEINGIYTGKNKIGGLRDANSGGNTVFFSPGLQWVSAAWVLEASVQLPIIQDLNGDANEVDYATTIGVRYRF